MTEAHSLQIRSMTGLDTIATRGCCELKIEEQNGTRHWLCTRPAGKTDHRIIIETYNPDTGEYTATQVFTDKEET